MLDLVEKGVLGLAGLIIVVLAALYFVAGLNSTVPAVAVRSLQVSAEEFEKGLSKAEKAHLEEVTKKADTLRAKTAQAHRPGRAGRTSRPPAPPKERRLVVTPQLYYRVSTRNAAIHELKKAKSKILRNPDKTVAGLRIYDFDRDALFGRLGFEEGDIVQSLDGQPLPTDLAEAEALYAQYQGSLSQGVPIVVDVVRRGQPVRLIFDIRDLKGLRLR